MRSTRINEWRDANLDGVRVGGALCGVDELIGQALGNGLDVAEGRLAGL